ncbi:hypothetical protein DH2020_028107 [Rehmannia glutinosa]|uniref:G domain-containing protein n=1 Tax=Rehmannia glutinosa TaxID=99300 RepID=A0ABR0VSB9_REHGL
MPKGEKTGLGRALVKHHNQMVQQSKEKGKYYRSHEKKVLESVTEVSDIEAVIEQADEAYRLYSALNPPGKIPINLDSTSSTDEMTAEERRKQQKKEEALHASSLRIPRRPPWNANMSVEELDDNERRAFLEWRRSLARLEENENLVLTPFEKNLDIWRQLWRVLERSDLLVMVVDARDPLFYRCPDLEAYAREIDEHKRTLLLVNKADLLPHSVRDKWAKYFHQHGILFVFWSAKAATATLEGKKLNPSFGMQSSQHETSDADTKIYGRDELLARLQFEAEEIVSMRSKSTSGNGVVAGNMQDHSVVVGFVGYPNVGKSSTINALVGGKRRVSRYEMIASGVLPIDRMTEQREAVQVVANRVPRSVIEDVYRISLPKPKPYEPQSRAPLGVEFLRSYCASRGYVASSGLPDETRAARQILKDYIDGKLPHFEMPPGISENEDDDEYDDDDDELSSSEINESDESDDEAVSVGEHALESRLEHVLSDLNSFDVDNGLASAKVAVKEKMSRAPHKQHKKPQRKKDRSWRIRDSEGDGMPVRVFQKPVNRGPLSA